MFSLSSVIIGLWALSITLYHFYASPKACSNRCSGHPPVDSPPTRSEKACQRDGNSSNGHRADSQIAKQADPLLHRHDTRPAGEQQVFLIVGASRGFGRAMALEALDRGHLVLATARSRQSLLPLADAGAHVLEIDVTSDEATLDAQMAEAYRCYGRLDHVIVAAGYVLEGAIEETSHEDLARLYEVNLFGVHKIIAAALPHLRRQGSGVLSAFSSIGGYASGPALAHYSASKWAMIGFLQGLADEVKPFGIQVCCVEPGTFRTTILDNEHMVVASRAPMDVYTNSAVGAAKRAVRDLSGKQPGNVDKAARILIDVFTQTGVAHGRPIPPRLPLGRDCLRAIEGAVDNMRQYTSEWRDVIISTDYDEETF